MGGVVKVYGLAASPFVATVLVCLEEAGAAYELVPVDMAAREHRTPHHIARNPFGKIPVLEDGELTLFESRAISRYVLRKYKNGATTDLLREGNLEESAMVDVWLEAEAHHYEPAISNIVQQCVILPMIGGTRNQHIVDENVEKLREVLRVYEARLGEHGYLAGEFISLADLAHFGFMHLLMPTEYATLMEECANVKAWWEELAARPAARKVAELMDTGFGAV
ncbi:glutathione S-transferase 4-like [Phragmites australis]|uniref:glutathione S-transferase 4-like n=1 Tax=Phragmites australis TaxID=29695 RepID=UPI002D78676E|nr:glutathione S-transferase 4-like [Phragmites australis]